METIKAYSLIEVKEFHDGENRTLTGIATSPRVDRVGDIVEPMGVQVSDDIPLFLHHDSRLVVGRAKFGKPTKAGIPFEASIPNVTEEGTLKARVDEAWQSVKYRLITAVSIGFRALEGKAERIKGGGVRYLETEVMELSLVPIPAQPDAVISQFKSMSDSDVVEKLKAFDQKHLPASGNEGVEGDKPASVEAAPNRPEVVFLNPPKPARKHQIIEVIK